MSAQLEIVLVCGLGRCGASMAMAMLEAGGFPVAGAYPSYEIEQAVSAGSYGVTGPLGPAFIRRALGRAVKVLDPQLNIPPAGPRYRAIWMGRDPIEQAKSILKFASALFPSSIPRGQSPLSMAAALEVDGREAQAMLVASSGSGELDVLSLTFEGILDDPGRAALAMGDFLAPVCSSLDLEAMAAVVERRSPRCTPDLALEVGGVERAEKGYQPSMGRPSSWVSA